MWLPLALMLIFVLVKQPFLMCSNWASWTYPAWLCEHAKLVNLLHAFVEAWLHMELSESHFEYIFWMAFTCMQWDR